MDLPIYYADAFTSTLFGGNSAALVPLDTWLPDDLLQAIAAENNLAETAYIVAEGEGFALRWFTPAVEIPLCGHATLATAHLLWTELGYQKDDIRFSTMSGELKVTRSADIIALDFPAQQLQPVELQQAFSHAINATPLRALEQVGGNDFLMLEFASADEVAALAPDMTAVAALPYNGVICSAPGQGFDCDIVSRFFAPAIGINEDPVTGSAHTLLVPYWAEKLDRTHLQARQISARGGELDCELMGERVIMRGKAVTYLRGTISV